MESLVIYFQTARDSVQVSLASRLPLLLFCLTFFLSGRMARAGQALDLPAQDARGLLEQLNNASIDSSQVYSLRDVQITRDRVRIYFNRGFIGFFKKTAGEITGAAFAGDGEVLLMPPDSVEKYALAEFTQSPILEEQFGSVYLRFTDQTSRELLAKARPPDPDAAEQPTGFAEQWDPVVRRLNAAHSIRILQDLLGDRDDPYFHAQFRGKNLGVFEISVDERLPEAVRVGAVGLSHGKPYADIWCSFPSRHSAARSASLMMGPAVTNSYKIDIRINFDNSLEGRADLALESRSSADRVLEFELSHQLNVSEVRDEQGKTLTVFRNPSLQQSPAAAPGDDWIAVVLPAPHPAGERFHLIFTYQGNVIANVGNGVLYVGAHGSWYPNRGLSRHAAYDLTFHFPNRLTLVATGRRAEESSSNGWKHSRWVSDGDFPVAGFNLGAYRSRVRRIGNVTVEVYATQEAEAALEKRHVAAQPPASVVIRQLGNRKISVGVIPKTVVPLAPAALLDKVADSAARALQYFQTLFGPFPYSRLAISQIPGSFGQGWPELVYLPTLSFLAPAERSELGLSGKAEDLQNQLFVAHEIAHQWWGDLVGWQTYHDQWLSEGFSGYAAALQLAREKDGESKFRELLREYKRDLLTKNKEGNTVESGGPIWLGRRLSSSLNPEGYNDIVYKKACWVLHMLRMLMRDPATGSDESFFKMIRNFVAACRDQNPSTEDFVRHAQTYMTRASDLEHNQRLDWFFNEWVYRTGIPSYKLQASIRRLGTNKFLIQGSLVQSEVPADFEMLVPVVAVYGPGHGPLHGNERKVTLGQVTVGDSGGHFRFTVTTKPTRVAVDEDSVLAVVR